MRELTTQTGITTAASITSNTEIALITLRAYHADHTASHIIRNRC